MYSKFHYQWIKLTSAAVVTTTTKKNTKKTRKAPILSSKGTINTLYHNA